MLLHTLRQQQPLVICLTNDVVKNFTANGLAAFGASPAMSANIEDLKDLLRHACALLVNIGTIRDDLWQLYDDAMAIATSYGVPIVLDPVACGASQYRKRVALDLLTKHKVDILRGNAGEIAALIGEHIATKGVDSSPSDNVAPLAQKAANHFKTTVIVTGVVDAVAQGDRLATIHNGSPMMPRVVGTGCLLGAIIAAVTGICQGDFEQLVNGLCAYNIAGELAATQTQPGSYQVAFVDALSQVSDAQVEEYRRVTYL